MKLSVLPVLGSLRKVVAALRNLPIPKPLQRLTERGLARLSAHIPELAELLGGKVRARSSARGRSDVRRNAAAASASDVPLSELLTQLASSDYRARLRVVQALAQHREKAAIDALGGALRDRSVEVAVAAVSSLQIVIGVTARPTLEAVLENEHSYYHPLVRAAAVHALGSLLPEAESAPLVKALRDRDAEVSIAAISALAASAPLRAGELLLQVVENRDGFFLPITRLAAASSLERLSWLPQATLERVRAAENDPQLGEVLERVAQRHAS